MRVLGTLLITVSIWAQDYRTSATGAPPPQLAPEVRQALQNRGTQVVDPNGFVFCELWLRSAPVSEGQSLPEALQAGAVPQGALVGAVRYASPGADRQGRGFGPGVYTLRYAEGSSVLMIRAGDDPNLEPPEQLEALSRKVSRSEAPAALRLTQGSPGSSPRLRITREGEWILEVALDGAPLALLIVGVAR